MVTTSLGFSEFIHSDMVIPSHMANLSVGKWFYTTLASVAGEFGATLSRKTRTKVIKTVRDSARQKRYTIQSRLVRFFSKKYPKPVMEMEDGVATKASKKAAKKFAKKGRVCCCLYCFLRISSWVRVVSAQIPKKLDKLLSLKESHARAVHKAWMERGSMGRVMKILGSDYFAMQVKVYWLVRHLYFTGQSPSCTF